MLPMHRRWPIGFGPVEIAPKRSVSLCELVHCAIGKRAKIVDTSPEGSLGLRLSLTIGGEEGKEYVKDEPLSMYGGKVIDNEFEIAPTPAGTPVCVHIENTTDEIKMVALTLIVAVLPQRKIQFGPMKIPAGARVPVTAVVKEALGRDARLIDLSPVDVSPDGIRSALFLTRWTVDGMDRLPPGAAEAPVSMTCYAPSAGLYHATGDCYEAGQEVVLEVLNRAAEPRLFAAEIADPQPLEIG